MAEFENNEIISKIEKRYQSDTKNSENFTEKIINWNTVFPSRYLSKYWENLPKESLPEALLKEFGYIVEHVREMETRFEYVLHSFRTTLHEHNLSIKALLRMQSDLRQEQQSIKKTIEDIDEKIQETKLFVLTLKRELMMVKTYPVNGSAIRLSSVGARRKIRSYVDKSGDRAS
jgi:hypothetical protein